MRQLIFCPDIFIQRGIKRILAFAAPPPPAPIVCIVVITVVPLLLIVSIRRAQFQHVQSCYCIIFDCSVAFLPGCCTLQASARPRAVSQQRVGIVIAPVTFCCTPSPSAPRRVEDWICVKLVGCISSTHRWMKRTTCGPHLFFRFPLFLCGGRSFRFRLQPCSFFVGCFACSRCEC